MKHQSLYELIRNNRYLCGVLYGTFYIQWFRWLENTVTAASKYHVMHCSLDNVIPFVPAFIIPYLFWFVYVFGAIIFYGIKDADEMTHLGIMLASGMSISLLICTFFHNGTDFRVAADPQAGICSFLTWVIQHSDTPTNVFPSIHVVNALAVNASVWHSRFFEKKPAARFASAAAAFLICLSTVFLKQHSALDVAGGIILAYVLDIAVYGGLWVGVPAYQKKKVRQAA